MNHELRQLARDLVDTRRRVRDLETAPRLGFSSFTGAIEQMADGAVVARFGQQPDGTNGTVIVDGPVPARPTLPALEPGAGVLTVTWDGRFSDDSPRPGDFAAVEVFIAVGRAPGAADLRGAIMSPAGGGKAFALDAGVYQVALRSKTVPGRTSALTAPVTVAVLAPMDESTVAERVGDAIDEAMAGVAADNVERDALLAQARADLDNLSDVVLPGLLSDLTTLTDTTLPALDALVDGLREDQAGLTAQLETLTGTTLPDIESALATLRDVTLPGMVADVEALELALPGLRDRLDAAETAIDDTLPEAIAQAVTAAETAGRLYTVSTAAPTTANGADRPVGAIWVRENASRAEIGRWRWTGSAWVTTTLDPTMIPNLAAGKITTGTLATARLNATEVAAAVASFLQLNANQITAGVIDVARLNAESVAAAVASFLTLSAGQITSGTIDTARLNATTVAAAVANLIQINASQITAGTIDVARLNASAVAAAVASFLSLNANQITAGTISTARLDAAAVGALVGSFVEARVDKLVVGTGTISTAVIQKLYAEVVNSRKITTEQLLVSGAQNLIPNGMGEKGDNSAWPTTVTYSQVDAPAGVPGYFTPPPGQGRVVPPSPFFEVQPDTEYLVEVWARADKPNSRFFLELRDAAGAHALTSQMKNVPGFPNTGTGGYLAGSLLMPTEWTKHVSIVKTTATARKVRLGSIFLNHTDGSERTATQSFAVRMRPLNDPALVVDGSILARQLDADALNGKIITGSLVQSTATLNRGVKFDSAGIRAYNSAGTQTANFGADGSAWINGAFQTAPSGQRLHLFQTTNGGALRIYTDDANDLNYGALNLVRDIQAQTRELWMSLTGNNNGTRHGLVRLGETITAITQNHNASDNQAAAFYVTRDGSYEGVSRDPGGSIRSLFYGRYNGDFNIGGGGAGRITLNKAGNTLVINKDDGHRIHLDGNGWTYAYGVGLSVQGALTVSGSKNFVMPHPDGSDRMLKHASTESPHNGVEYWSQEPATVGDDGSCWVDLPDYFGPLTSIRGRAVFLTAHSPDAGLWSEEVGSDGFRVYGAPGARFSWLVKARRVQHDADGVDQLAFDVEYDRNDSAGDGGVAPIEPEPTVQVEPPSDEIE